MNASLRLLTLAATLSVGLVTGLAADKHDHAHKATPKGGRLLEKTEPHAEFVVEKDRQVSIHFYNDKLKPVPATTQQVVVIADAKSGKARLEFELKGDALVSKSKLPEGDGYNVIVQFKQAPDAKPMNLRFKLDLQICGGCKRAEYGCTCDH